MNRATLSRRDLLARAGSGAGLLGLAALMQDERSLTSAIAAPAKAINPLAAKPPHFAPKAKNVIFLHMIGAPSHLDLFDYKPVLQDYDGKLCPKKYLEGQRFAFLRGDPKLLGTRLKFQKHGES